MRRAAGADDAVGLEIPISVPIISVQSRPKIEISQVYRIDTSENSTDLSSGRRPLSKSVEFSEVSILFVEI